MKRKAQTLSAALFLTLSALAAEYPELTHIGPPPHKKPKVLKEQTCLVGENWMDFQVIASASDEDSKERYVCHNFVDAQGNADFCWFFPHTRPLHVGSSTLPPGLCIVYQSTENKILCNPDEPLSRNTGRDFAFYFVDALIAYNTPQGTDAIKLSAAMHPLGTRNDTRGWRIHTNVRPLSDTPKYSSDNGPPLRPPTPQKFVRQDNRVVCDFYDSHGARRFIDITAVNGRYCRIGLCYLNPHLYLEKHFGE